MHQYGAEYIIYGWISCDSGTDASFYGVFAAVFSEKFFAAELAGVMSD